MVLRIALIIIVAVVAGSVAGCEAPPPEPDHGRIEPVVFANVRLTDEFWAPRMEINRTVTIPHLARQNEESGRIDNFRKAAGRMDGAFVGFRFNDSDVYKSIEAASYALAQTYDPALDAELDELIELIAASQMDDGYLFPAYTVDPENPPVGVSTNRWELTNANSHELYGNGHLIEAAVAHYRATGKRTLLDVAIRAAEGIDRVFGGDGRRDTSGHEEIELALVKLYDVTGKKRYLDLAKFFIDVRGHEHDYSGDSEDSPLARYDVPIYRQDHLPVIEQNEAVGHSVRAMYLYMGMADVAARTDAIGYREALDALWDDVAAKKMYLTGGIGAAGTFESFGDAYQLPNQSAYAETCAAIGNDMWNHRMFLASGDARYLDIVERILYNGFLSGVSLEGDSFFYTNPLASDGDHERRAYFDVACCPSNLARLMGQLPGFIYALEGDTVYVNLFIGSEAEIAHPSGTLMLTQQTRFPWEGAVRLIVEPASEGKFPLLVRIPGWATNAPVPSDLYTYADTNDANPSLAVNGETFPLDIDAGFAVIDRAWSAGDVVELDLPMPVRRVRAHDNVENNRGRIAIQRGPLVYAIEAIDNGGSALDVVLPADAELSAEYRPEMLGGVSVVRGTAERSGAAIDFLAVPYFAWANRARVKWPFGWASYRKGAIVDFKKHYLDNTRFEFQRMKGLAERALEQIPGVDGFHFELDKASNSIAVLIQHLSGNMVSRWTDFLTSDGEKPNRHRDSEFEPNAERTRDELMEIWERGWSSLFESLNALSAEELNETVVIRGEEHTVVEAIQRQIVHASYHIGQLVYLARHVTTEGWQSLSIRKGQSQGAPGRYKML